MRFVTPGAAVVAALVATTGPAPAQEGTWALTNARIETVTRGVIERGTIVIRDGLIVAVGASVTVPSDARVVDLTSKTVSPGLIDLTSTMGLASSAPPPAGRVAAPAPGPAVAAGPIGLEPDRTIADELKLSGAEVKSARDAGITAVLVAPSRGAFRGMSALVPLRDSAGTSRVLRSPVALHMGFQGIGSGFGGDYPGTLLGVIAYERQAFYDAQRLGLMLDRYRAGQRGMARPEYDARLAALVPVVRGTMPVFFDASNENEIRRAVREGKEFDLKLVITGATEGFRALDALAGRPVVVSVNFPKSNEVTGWTYHWMMQHAPNDSAAADRAARPLIEGNAAALHRAGIKIALASGGTRAPDFLSNVRKAIAAGLPRDVALQAMTIRPAELVGMGEALGSIEAGKIANLVVSDGSLLGDSTRVRWVFVDGARYEVTAPAARAAVVGGAATAQVAGTWALTVNSPQGAQDATLTVAQDGNNFSGTMTSQAGTAPIADGQVAGKTVSWTISLTMGGQSVTISFTGEVDGNRMSGSAQLGSFGTATFSGDRKP
ncbi:MAG: amidohydrolase family protein [Gemmatimonadota bacterium]|nr:amidohydrolase family protein [Gemmatimonadota bacterium]